MEKWDDNTFKFDTVCPKCNEVMDALTTFEDDSTPSKGDISICINCLQILQFDSDLKLKIVTDDEFVDFPCEDRTNINNMLTALIYARKTDKPTT
jgi:hypothetical protein